MVFTSSDAQMINLDVLSVGLSVGLSTGYAVGVLVVFFTSQYPKNGMIGMDSVQKWWGNTIYMKTADYTGVPFKGLPEGGTFGSSGW